MLIFDERFRILFLLKVGLATFHDHIGVVMVIDRVPEKDLFVRTTEGFFEPTSDVAGGKIAGAGGEHKAVEAQPGRQARTGRSESSGSTYLHEMYSHHYNK